MQKLDIISFGSYADRLSDILEQLRSLATEMFEDVAESDPLARAMTEETIERSKVAFIAETVGEIEQSNAYKKLRAAAERLEPDEEDDDEDEDNDDEDSE